VVGHHGEQRDGNPRVEAIERLLRFACSACDRRVAGRADRLYQDTRFGLSFLNESLALPPKELAQMQKKLGLLAEDPTPDAKTKKQLKYRGVAQSPGARVVVGRVRHLPVSRNARETLAPVFGTMLAKRVRGRRRDTRADRARLRQGPGAPPTLGEVDVSAGAMDDRTRHWPAATPQPPRARTCSESGRVPLSGSLTRKLAAFSGGSANSWPASKA
jgi:hypothetical protein